MLTNATIVRSKALECAYDAQKTHITQTCPDTLHGRVGMHTRCTNSAQVMHIKCALNARRSGSLRPLGCLAEPHVQAFARGRLLRPSRAVPVVLAGCVVCSDTISNYHSHRYARFDAQRPYGRSARAHEGHRETRRALKGVRGASYESRQRNIYSEQVGSHSWSMPSTSSCQKVRFVELRPVPAFQIARAHHIGSAAYADGALSVSIMRSISMIRGQGSEARHHGTPVRAQ